MQAGTYYTAKAVLCLATPGKEYCKYQNAINWDTVTTQYLSNNSLSIAMLQKLCLPSKSVDLFNFIRFIKIIAVETSEIYTLTLRCCNELFKRQ